MPTRRAIMSERPAIVVVDDEPTALTAMLDALTRQFGTDYHIVPYLSAASALGAVSAVKKGTSISTYSNRARRR
jgi:hypothetical protein